MTTATSTGRFDGGRVVGAAFAVLGKRWVALGVLYICLSAAPLIAGTLYRPAPASLAHNASAYSIYAAVTVGLLVIGWIRTAIIVSVALQPIDAPLRPGPAFADAMRSIPALLPFWLIGDAPALAPLWLLGRPSGVGTSALAIGAASLLIAVGTWLLRLILAMTWGVVTPVAVAERRGVVGTLTRGVQLMNGARWPFLALYILAELAQGIPAFLTGIVVAFLLIGRRLGTTSLLQTERLLILAPTLLAAIVSVIWYVVIATAYQEMRRVRDGLPADHAADIFA